MFKLYTEREKCSSEELCSILDQIHQTLTCRQVSVVDVSQPGIVCKEIHHSLEVNDFRFRMFLESVSWCAKNEDVFLEGS